LLFDETIPSFIWLFETFLTAMSGKHPSTIFTDQDAAMAGAIAYIFPNTSHRLCLWHIYLNAAKHLSHVINKHPKKFLPAFKSCVYEDRSEECFEEKWNKLLTDYSLQENSWMLNLYDLRKKWAAVYRDSFTADMTTTQRSEGMNNVFKYIPDFPVKYIPDFPLLKTAAESYTRRMYKEFEEEFKSQFSFTCKLVQAEGSISTFMVTHRDSNVGATVVLNTTDKTITYSCRKFESIGMYTVFELKFWFQYKLLTSGFYTL
jgi:zinc finger SWIM domain-containing protein 3